MQEDQSPRQEKEARDKDWQIRIARAIVYSPSREGREGARESVANTKLPDDHLLVAMAQHEKELREHI